MLAELLISHILIEEALLSALNQDYESFEVIFVDNESTDKSQRIAKNVGEKYPNLILASAKNIYKSIQ